MAERFVYAVSRFFKERFYDQSAQTAYYFMLSIFPFLFMAFSIASFLPINSGDLLTVIEPYAPANSYDLIQYNLSAILDSGQGRVLSISVIATFWLSSMSIQSLVRSMNDVYNVKREQGFIRGLFGDFFLTMGLVVVLPLSILIPILEKLLYRWVEQTLWFSLDWFHLWAYVRWGIGTLTLFLFFWLLYRYLPSCRLSWRSVIPGAIFATIGWQAISEGFSLYVSHGDYTRLYGQLGSVIILMIWFYLTAVILLFGGLLNVYRKK
ncbi:YihY/virulence factor BrkB family protein [Jeotgalibacillus soli]|uniref:YihY/virulence factor BrkB family protein n=1 Tax=Jeotgalibacillus soli TaxID=889306 RepID=A0A0C2R5U8_9BACL|nr:YihY/virulence factor BrkB family protein [Jeotgalibacillus soli]KIL45630.1 hypothetical protein KP78_19790 [Jeotgalibacillus soli]